METLGLKVKEIKLELVRCLVRAMEMVMGLGLE